MRQLIRAPLQLGVTDLLLAKDERRQLRRLSHLRRKQPIDALLFRILTRCRVPLHQQLPALVFTQQRQTPKLPRRIIYHPQHQGLQLTQQSLHRARFINSAIIRKPQRRIRRRQQRERETVLFRDPQLLEGYTLLLLLQTFSHRIVLKHHERLEQVLPAFDVAPALHIHERAVLILPQLHHLRLQLTQPWSNLRFLVHSHAHRQAVDEQSHHLLDAGEFCRPTRNSRAKQHLFFTAVTAQQQRPRTLHQRVHRHLLLARKALHALALRRTQPHLLLGVAARAIRGALERQLRRSGEARERVAPVSFRAAHVLLFQPDDVVSKRTRLVQLQRLTATTGFVKRKHLLQQQRHRPAVEQNVVMTPDELVGVWSELQQEEAQQRRLGELKAARTVGR